MARTSRGEKGPGHEYWGRRTGSGLFHRDPGKFTKKMTHRKERRQGKQEAKS